SACSLSAFFAILSLAVWPSRFCLRTTPAPSVFYSLPLHDALPIFGFFSHPAADNPKGLLGVLERTHAKVDVTKYAACYQPHYDEREVSSEDRNGKEYECF